MKTARQKLNITSLVVVVLVLIVAAAAIFQVFRFNDAPPDDNAAVFNHSQLDALRQAIANYTDTGNADAVNNALSGAIARAQTQNNMRLAQAESAANQAFIIIAVSGAIAALVAVIFIASLQKSIAQPAEQLADAAEKIAGGATRLDIPIYESECEMGRIYRGLTQIAANLEKTGKDHDAFVKSSDKAVLDLETELKNMLAAVEKLAAGEFATSGGYSQKSQYAKATDELASTLRDICGETSGVIGRAAQGDFNKSFDTNKYKGQWSKLSQEIARLQAASLPITQAKAVLDGLAQGKFDVKVNADAQGDLLQLKTAANGAAAALQKHVAAIISTIENASRGRTHVDLPGAFAPIKAAITATQPQAAPAATRAPIQRSFSAAEKAGQKPGIDSARKFSGAAKTVSAPHTKGEPDYTKSDFGKY